MGAGPAQHPAHASSPSPLTSPSPIRLCAVARSIPSSRARTSGRTSFPGRARTTPPRLHAQTTDDLPHPLQLFPRQRLRHPRPSASCLRRWARPSRHQSSSRPSTPGRADQPPARGRSEREATRRTLSACPGTFASAWAGTPAAPEPLAKTPPMSRRAVPLGFGDGQTVTGEDLTDGADLALDHPVRTARADLVASLRGPHGPRGTSFSAGDARDATTTTTATSCCTVNCAAFRASPRPGGVRSWTSARPGGSGSRPPIATSGHRPRAAPRSAPARATASGPPTRPWGQARA